LSIIGIFRRKKNPTIRRIWSNFTARNFDF